MPRNDPLERGTREWREAQAARYVRPRRHAAICRHCQAVIAETREFATTGVCTRCYRRGRV
jgi:hypothetical protein